MTKKKKTNWFIKLLIFLGVIVGIAAIAWQFVPAETKKEIFRSTGIENSDFVSSTSMDAYVELTEISSREQLLGNNWLINIGISNTHSSQPIRRISVKFMFSDFNEKIDLFVNVPAQNTVARVERVKIPGHSGATYYGCELTDAE